jgi:hypothetical protein
MPKKLSEKEKKRREEMKRLKDVENLEKIQKKLFKDRPGKNNKINPIKKQEITNYENAFLKECREVFSKDNKSISKASLNTTKNNEKEKEKEKIKIQLIVLDYLQDKKINLKIIMMIIIL